VVAPTEQEARAMLGTKAARFGALLLCAAEDWQAVGMEHPFGERFRGYVDFVPERYDRKTLEEAIAAVPAELVSRSFIWGTPEQVVSRLKDFGRAGLRHVVLTLTSALLSRRAAVHGLRATRRIARALAKGQ
jgi:phthiodiolone/phenolphthiodiolone dimycocerosates ketoreductase